MGVIAYFLTGIILEDPPAPVWFLHPKGTPALLGINDVLQSVFPGNLKGSSGKGGELEVLVKILSRLPDPEGNRGNP